MFWWSPIFAILGVFLLKFIPQHPDRFRDQSCIVFMGIWGIWSALISKKLRSKVTLPLLIWIGFSAVSVFGVKYSPFKGFAQFFDGPAGISLLWFTLALTALSDLKIRWLLFEFYVLAALVNAALLLFHFKGILDNDAMDASLCVLVAPRILFSRYHHLGFKILLVSGILASMSSTGIFGLMAVALAYAFFKIKPEIAIWSALIFGLGAFLQGPELISSNGRVRIWTLIYDWYMEHGNIITGMGLGSFEVLAPSIQKDHGFTNGFFVFAHNEWFQIFFELGLIGLCLSIFAYISFLVRNKNITHRVSWIALGVIAMSQSPFRVPLLGIWSSLLVMQMGDEWT